MNEMLAESLLDKMWLLISEVEVVIREGRRGEEGRGGEERRGGEGKGGNERRGIGSERGEESRGG